MNTIDAIAMMNQGLLLKNIKNEMPHQIKSEQQQILNGVYDSEMLGQTETPIDLSRRCDSVETRKTPSPYNSSGFGESSPSHMNESPNSLRRSSNNYATALTRTRSDTPTNAYQAAAYLQQTYSSQSELPQYTFDESTPSPPESMHHRFIQDQINSTDDEIKPYILQALQQKLQNIPATVSTNQLSSESIQYPMIMGRDGKMTRPFKAYPREPLHLCGGVSATDPLIDRISNERFNVFRQQMLEQIHAANGGMLTITNPKMSRNAQKNNDLQQKQMMQIQRQMSSQSDSSSNGIPATNSKSVELTKDQAYFERRKKNNAAAKKSRDRRRIKEDEIAIRAAFLERENLELKIELAATKRQLAQFLEK